MSEEPPKQAINETPDPSPTLYQLNEILAQHPEIVSPATFEAFINSRRVKPYGVSPKESPIWKEITRRFGVNVKHAELVSIASVLANSANIRLDREAKRRKTVLVKWFEENFSAIQPFLDYVVLEDPD